VDNQHEEFEPRQNIILCSKPSDRDLDPDAQRERLHSAGPILKRNAYMEALVDRVWVSEIKGGKRTPTKRDTKRHRNQSHGRYELMHECPSSRKAKAPVITRRCIGEGLVSSLPRHEYQIDPKKNSGKHPRSCICSE